jgi:hypothetical protein
MAESWITPAQARLCPRCQHLTDRFHPNASKRSGYQTYCRTCRKELYRLAKAGWDLSTQVWYIDPEYPTRLPYTVAPLVKDWTLLSFTTATYTDIPQLLVHSASPIPWYGGWWYAWKLRTYSPSPVYLATRQPYVVPSHVLVQTYPYRWRGIAEEIQRLVRG